MSEDRFVQETEQAEQEAWQGDQEERAANLFDLRRIIGGVFVLYGVVLTVVGLTDGQAELHKAAGLRINLIAGLGMLALGFLFLIWAFTRPLGKQLREERDAS